MEKNHPLILVFYLDAELMKQQEIIMPFVDSVKKVIESKQANIISFFMPTKGEERIECLNPSTIKDADMEKINKMVEEIKKNFSIGEENTNIPDLDIELDPQNEND
jgi:hypothetical protein